MSVLSIDQFAPYFEALHHDRDRPDEVRSPYAWQRRLATRAIEGDWPAVVDLPTGSGKTACLDVAVFALACQAARPPAERSAPRRIFFCVNRRVIVDEAFDRARRIAQRLADAEQDEWRRFPVLAEVARAFRALAGRSERRDVPPLDAVELRGGIYRDNRWARSVAQPTIVCTTVDQLGSRLLFRGYGVSPEAAPIQASLIAYDSLVLLDEAHISQPLQQTLKQVRRYLDGDRWAEAPIGPRPMIVVPMTATPPGEHDGKQVIRLDADDRKNESLDARLRATKSAVLRPVGDVVRAITAEASQTARGNPVAIGIIVNRVASARAIYESLREECQDIPIELVIGAMRPIDRDTQAQRLADLVGRKRPTLTTKTSVVVSTQCLEVGADYDFDVLLTECASLDALRQRFGRLNRAGRPISVRAAIFVRDKDIMSDDALSEKQLDPIYGHALVRTWNWLSSKAAVVERITHEEALATGGRAKSRPKSSAIERTIDFGIDAFGRLIAESFDGGAIQNALLAPAASTCAPVMLPAYVDFWCQTSPTPVPDPDVALFLHGKQRREPDAQVCWRADLLDEHNGATEEWLDVVGLVPPTSAECMTVPLARLRRWLAGDDPVQADLGDALEVAADSNGETEESARVARRAVIWRGSERSIVLGSRDNLDKLRPGDTVVLPVSGEGWNALGHIPNAPERNRADDGDSKELAKRLRLVDIAEDAFRLARDRAVLRLHPTVLPGTPFELDRVNDLLARLNSDVPPSKEDWRELLNGVAAQLSDQFRLRESLALLCSERGFLKELYPDRSGVVLTSRDRFRSNELFVPPLDDGEDDASRVLREHTIPLNDHTEHVRNVLSTALGLLHVAIPRAAYDLAALRHDWGKVDDRFQAWLMGSVRTDAWLWASGLGQPLAKSDGVPRTREERRAARERAGLPDGFRHEMLSMQLAERFGLPPELAGFRDLILHLIAAHHGCARPFAPVVIDEDPPEVAHGGATVSAEDRRNSPPHCLDSGIAERFWALTRRYGWWGLAYLEAVLRLADQQASAAEDAGWFTNEPVAESQEALT
jgi:CRISPR-associated endonuclease/helicase Cas3